MHVPGAFGFAYGPVTVSVDIARAVAEAEARLPKGADPGNLTKADVQAATGAAEAGRCNSIGRDCFIERPWPLPLFAVAGALRRAGLTWKSAFALARAALSVDGGSTS